MASNSIDQIHSLSENDVPGAKLSYSMVEKHSNVQLKRWLKCRDIKSSGNKSELVERVKQCIEAGNSKKISNGIDGGKWYDLKIKQINLGKTQSNSVRVPLPPITGWNHFPSVNLPKHFNHGHIHHHIVESVQFMDQADLENEEDPDVEDLHTEKPLRKGEEYFRSGHVQNMKDCAKNGIYFLKAVVLASYDTKTEYNTMVQLSVDSGFVKDASCTCAAMAMGRCAHVTGLLFALKDYVEKYGADTSSCTSKPCNWNKGRLKKKNPKSVKDASYPSVKKRKVDSIIEYDPTPMYEGRNQKEALKDFMSAVDCGEQQTMWQTLLYREYKDYTLDSSETCTLKDQTKTMVTSLSDNEGGAKELIKEQNTENWLNHRRVRVTASESKRVSSASSNQSINNILRAKLWSDNRITTSAMLYGTENEDKAYLDYKTSMEEEVNLFKVEKSGFWISTECPGIGASPDGLVFDPREESPHGLLEIKCPMVLKNQTVKEFDNILTKKQCFNFCLIKSDNKISLKKTHSYYFQIQTQLGVTGRQWCDLVVWGSKGNAVTVRVRFEETFWNELKGKLSTFHQTWLLPEFFEMRIPRRLMPSQIV